MILFCETLEKYLLGLLKMCLYQLISPLEIIPSPVLEPPPLIASNQVHLGHTLTVMLKLL